MSSLKTFLYPVAGILRISPASLYERQRELVRHGLLPMREGRGPGSGVPLTAETVATFLIGLLATDSLSDMAEHTSALCSAKLRTGPPSKPAANRTFHADLANALAGVTNDRVRGIQVTRHWRGCLRRAISEGEDVAGENSMPEYAEYVVSDEARRTAPALSHTASLEDMPFFFICTRLRSELNLPNATESGVKLIEAIK